MATNETTGREGLKKGPLWTDKIIVGGSDPLQTAGPVVIIESSGTNTTTTYGGAATTSFGGALSGAAMQLYASGGVFTTNISGATTSVFGKSIIATGSIQALTYGVPVANLGSPVSSSQLLIQCGSGSLGAGSTAWVAFPVGFGAVPAVTVTSLNSAVDDLINGSKVVAGSFFVHGKTASAQFMWTAIGTK